MSVPAWGFFYVYGPFWGSVVMAVYEVFMGVRLTHAARALLDEMAKQEHTSASGMVRTLIERAAVSPLKGESKENG